MEDEEDEDKEEVKVQHVSVTLPDPPGHSQTMEVVYGAKKGTFLLSQSSN